MIKEVYGYCPKMNCEHCISIEYIRNQSLKDDKNVKGYFDCEDADYYNCDDCPIYEDAH